MRRRGWIAFLLIVVWWLWPTQHAPTLIDSWQAGVHEHDYLQSLDLRSDGVGSYAFGYAQLLRFEARFRYRVIDAHALELYDIVELDREGQRHPHTPSRVRVRYERRDGTFCSRHPYREERCYRSRLHVEELPFPGSYDTYFAQPLD